MNFDDLSITGFANDTPWQWGTRDSDLVKNYMLTWGMSRGERNVDSSQRASQPLQGYTPVQERLDMQLMRI